jgi:hypothetical protein
MGNSFTCMLAIGALKLSTARVSRVCFICSIGGVFYIVGISTPAAISTLILTVGIFKVKGLIEIFPDEGLVDFLRLFEKE